MDDLISRQAAIKAICEDGTWLESQGCTEITMAERKQRDADILSELPSAQPEHRFDEWCTECKEYDKERHCCPRFNHVIRTTLQEVQEERKKGEWINHRNDNGHNIADCSECGNAIQWFDGDEKPRFCCMCGADMRGEQDG